MSKNSIDYDSILKLPKVELHLHLDCSLSFDVVSKLRPGITIENYKRDFIAPPKCINLADFLKRASNGIELMQNEPALELVVEDLFDQLKKENVILAEIRFAPLLHTKKGLEADNVVEIVASKVKHCSRESGIIAGLILCTLRDFNEGQSLETAKLVKGYLPDSVVIGFDLAADEAGYPLNEHLSAFQYAIDYGLPRTVHSGEARGAESMREVINFFHPSRIGHGVRCIEDEKLVDEIVDVNIHLEICPSCNIQTNIFNSFEDHPIDFLFNKGVSLSVNTDSRALTNISLTEEYQKLISSFGWGLKELRKCNLNAIEHSFISKMDKSRMKRYICEEY